MVHTMVLYMSYFFMKFRYCTGTTSFWLVCVEKFSIADSVIVYVYYLVISSPTPSFALILFTSYSVADLFPRCFS